MGRKYGICTKVLSDEHYQYDSNLNNILNRLKDQIERDKDTEGKICVEVSLIVVVGTELSDFSVSERKRLGENIIVRELLYIDTDGRYITNYRI